MKKYLISIDFASKLGWSLWDKENKQLLEVGKFNFVNNKFNKEFKKTGFQNKIFEKTIFEKNETEELLKQMLNNVEEKSEIDVILEYSDFGFKYVIEHLSRLVTLLFVELDKNKDKYKFNVQKIIAVSWRKHFKDNSKNIDFSKYETEKSKNGKTRKQIDWKTLAMDWSNKYVEKIKFNIKDEEKANNDIADSIIIGYTWLNFTNSQVKEKQNKKR